MPQTPRREDALVVAAVLGESPAFGIRRDEVQVVSHGRRRVLQLASTLRAELLAPEADQQVVQVAAPVQWHGVALEPQRRSAHE
eukprot:5680125-Heterocapsa_arctica.AAC.1